MALDLLLDPEIPLVTITGRAGTGKTLLALAAGLYLTQDAAIYQKMLVARPVVPLGRTATCQAARRRNCVPGHSRSTTI